MAEELQLTASRRSRRTGGQQNGGQRLSKVKNQRRALGTFSKGNLPETLLLPDKGDASVFSSLAAARTEERKEGGKEGEDELS